MIIGYSFFERLFSSKTGTGIMSEFKRSIESNNVNGIFSELSKLKFKKKDNWINNIEEYFKRKELFPKDKNAIVMRVS